MRQIGRYVVIRELGRGAMGVVFEARDPLIGRIVAVKIIRLDALGSSSEADWLHERLLREARSAGALSHPGIVVIHDLGRHEDLTYIAMERVDGPTLEQLLTSGESLSTAQSLSILRQTAAALDYAHQNDVVHRDIKPGNLMLHRGVTLKITDFGIAKIASTQQLTRTGTVMGTPSYMSPEQITAKPVDGRADQFSLAVIAFELLAGRKPFQGDTLAALVHQIVYEERPSARSVRPDLPEAADAVLRRGLSKNAGDRYSSCTAFVDALDYGLLQESLLGRSSAQAPRSAVVEAGCKVCGTALSEGQLQCSVCANFVGTETFFKAAFGTVDEQVAHPEQPIEAVPQHSAQAPLAAPARDLKPANLSNMTPPERLGLLTGLRAADFESYLAELTQILSDPRLNLDTTKSVLGLLKTLPVPTPREWKIVESVADGGNARLAAEAMTVFGASIEWYRLAEASGAIARWSEQYDIADSWFSCLWAFARRRFEAIPEQSEPAPPAAPEPQVLLSPEPPQSAFPSQSESPPPKPPPSKPPMIGSGGLSATPVAAIVRQLEFQRPPSAPTAGWGPWIVAAAAFSAMAGLMSLFLWQPAVVIPGKSLHSGASRTSVDPVPPIQKPPQRRSSGKGVSTSTALPVVSFTASPSSIKTGESASLEWSASNAAGVHIEPDLGPEPMTGRVRVSPAKTTTYLLVATGAGGETGATVTVAVTPSPDAGRYNPGPLEQIRAQAEHGSAVAQNDLGSMYQTGQGVPRDDAQAIAWYRKAADQGFASAQYNLGVMFQVGRGVPKDDSQAAAWYRKAADQSNALAQHNLGWMYEYGQGVPKDRTQAINWYRRASDNGSQDAKVDLARLGVAQK